MTSVELVDLTKAYAGGSAPAVRGLSLDVRSGELVALLGPSGCGKTTTLKMIAGLAAPTSGDIAFDRRSVLALPPERREAAMVFQKPLLFPYMSVGDNIGFGLRMRCRPPDEIRSRVAQMLELVQLPGLERRRPGQLSGGQEQRVSLARALVVQPRVLLLDEPLSQLDAGLRVEMREAIADIQRRVRITTVFVTHDQEEATALADRIALMFDGRLAQYDAPRAFYERPASERVARFFGGLNFIRGEKRGDAFVCALGALRLDDSPAPDGPGVLTIRPEAVGVGAEGPNGVRARVLAAAYGGTQMRYRLLAGDTELHATAPAASAYAPGDEVTLTLPAQRLWVLPAEHYL
jgi:ABC-type Fe3+/spermidine/putrescine transport system ATPase subunit